MKLLLEQLGAIFGGLKWVIAISLLVSGMLFFPEQVRELYRIAASEDGAIAVKEFISIAAIAIAVWLGALQVAAGILSSQRPLPKAPHLLLRHLPLVLGLLPVVSAAAAQFPSRPKQVPDADQVGSVLRIQNEALGVVLSGLRLHAAILFAIAAVIAAIMYVAGDRMQGWSSRAHDSYFTRHRFLALTAAMVVIVTAIFIRVPVAIPQALGAFGILAVFTFCLTAICAHLSLLTIKHRIPFIPILLTIALAISYLDLNDNHFIRRVTVEPASMIGPAAPRSTAGQAFVEWLRQRAASPDAPGSNAMNGREFPVFIVTTQGGGIYAAYNAAVFLSRMQDLCPSFHHHLFAISSVSGGSIGAATFAAALDAAGRKGPQSGAQDDDPCPLMRRFYSNAHADRLDRIGETEENVDRALSRDFLSPLIAATLFPDFMQSVIPRGIGALDRARALEYTLENAADAMYEANKNAAAANLLKRPYRRHWDPKGPLPALLMNATDTGSGKRVVISPFDFEKGKAPGSDVCVLTDSSASDHFTLSTAAFISARFPWVTPAVTVEPKDITNGCIGQEPSDKPTDKIRLVDGGYIDNSGVETALDLIKEINAAAEAARTESGKSIPNFRIYLFSLSGGDFPSHREFSFNELMEPIRALLSAREARAYIAINRAKLELAVVPAAHPVDQPKPIRSADLPVFNRTSLQNYFYKLPLGWAMSDKTRDIIALESGRFWDCEPNPENFFQSRVRLSNADCLQRQIYHLLSNSAKEAVAGLDAAKEIADRLARMAPRQPAARLNHEALLQCYERDWWQQRTRRPVGGETPGKIRYLAYHQADHIRELLREWDRHADITDETFLAYILGAVSYDSNDFSRTTENLTFKTADLIRSTWPGRIKEINDHRKQKTPPLPEVDLEKMTNNPEDLANLVWGWEGNWFGNNKAPDGSYHVEMKDGWKYRPRGIYQIIGREQFRDHSRWVNQASPPLGIDLLEEPDALLNRTVSAKVAFAHFINARLRGGQRLAEFLRDHPGDFAEVRRRQADMHDGTDEGLVAERGRMFLACIQKAAPTLSTQVSTGPR
jgi:predicted chitinase